MEVLCGGKSRGTAQNWERVTITAEFAEKWFFSACSAISAVTVTSLKIDRRVQKSTVALNLANRAARIEFGFSHVPPGTKVKLLVMTGLRLKIL